MAKREITQKILIGSAKGRKGKGSGLTKEQNELFLSYAKKTNNQIVKELRSDVSKGLSLKKVEQNKEKYGLNTFSSKKKNHWYTTFFTAFVNPFSMILIVIAILTVTIPLMLNNPPDVAAWVQFAIIMAMVIISGILKTTQESKSSKASEKLKEMIKTTTAIVRDGVKKEIPIEEVVPGDIVHLAAGDMIPADIRILSAKDLFITQSALTGESEPVEKFARRLDDDVPSSALECNNLCFMGTSVSSGSAIGIVVNTGKNTIFGRIARYLNSKKVKTNFDKGIEKVSWILIATMLVMTIIIFIIRGFRTPEGGEAYKWLYALNFALAIAVGLTPEMLPMIVTVNLAKEAFRLSKQKTIVKNINSIQSFGAMDILCTDKTGTLTEDKIVLERHLNLEEDEDTRVLSYAFLNSYYQTGLKNLIDLAVIEKADLIGIDDPIMGFTKVDEIPFDFKRRRMSVIIADGQNHKQLVTKGAFEEIADVCKYAEFKGQIVPFTEEIEQKARKIVTNLNNQGMRVIAIAINHDPLSEDHPFCIADEKNMTLIGFIALLDPPKESASKAIKALHNYGVKVKVLTGDNAAVTSYICQEVGISSNVVLTGSDIERMNDDELKGVVEEVNIFAKLSPEQKARIVRLLREKKHVVGYMGDGINDAAAMKMADIGISVDTAVDIAKESADIILLEKDLMILEKGVVEGRKTFCNIVKYINMTVSSNFGNMLSMIIGVCWLPFEPMFAIQILLLNIIYDFSQLAIPWDNVDESFIQKPRQWSARSIFKFMIVMGPISTIFDVTSFLILYFGFKLTGSGTEAQVADQARTFQTCWFMASLFTQSAVINVLRTERVPFFQSNCSLRVSGSNAISMLVGTIFCLAPGLTVLNFNSLATSQFYNIVDSANNPAGITCAWWILIAIGVAIEYMCVAQLIKIAYIKVNKRWL